MSLLTPDQQAKAKELFGQDIAEVTEAQYKQIVSALTTPPEKKSVDNDKKSADSDKKEPDLNNSAEAKEINDALVDEILAAHPGLDLSKEIIEAILLVVDKQNDKHVGDGKIDAAEMKKVEASISRIHLNQAPAQETPVDHGPISDPVKQSRVRATEAEKTAFIKSLNESIAELQKAMEENPNAKHDLKLLIAKLDTKISKQANGNYEELRKVAYYYINRMAELENHYDSKKDVEKLRKELTKGQNILPGSFEDKVVKSLIDDAKQNQITKEMDRMKNMYAAVLEMIPEGKDVEYTAVFQSMKKVLKAEGLWNESYTQAAYKKFVKGITNGSLNDKRMEHHAKAMSEAEDVAKRRVGGEDVEETAPATKGAARKENVNRHNENIARNVDPTRSSAYSENDEDSKFAYLVQDAYSDIVKDHHRDRKYAVQSHKKIKKGDLNRIGGAEGAYHLNYDDISHITIDGEGGIQDRLTKETYVTTPGKAHHQKKVEDSHVYELCNVSENFHELKKFDKYTVGEVTEELFHYNTDDMVADLNSAGFVEEANELGAILEKKSVEYTFKQMRTILTAKGKENILQKLEECRATKAKGAKLNEAVNKLKETNEELANAIIKSYNGNIPQDATVADLLDKIRSTKEYDLTSLADKLRNYVGADFVLNRVEDKQKKIGEIHNCRSVISYELGIPGNELSDDDVERFVCNLLGFTPQEKDHTPRSLAGAAAIFESVLTTINGNKVGTIFIDTSLHIELDMNVIVKDGGNINNAIGQAVAQGFTATTVDGKLIIDAPKQIWLNIPLGTWEDLGFGLGVAGLAMAVESAIGHYEDEPTCMTTSDYNQYDVMYTDANLAEAKEVLTNPEKAAELSAAINSYTVGNNFDHAAYHNRKRVQAGLGSPMNYDECLNNIAKSNKIKPEGEDINIAEKEEKEMHDILAEKDETTTVNFDNVRKLPVVKNKTRVDIDWITAANQYDCLKGLTTREKSIFMKMIQAMKTNDFSKKNLDRLFPIVKAACNLPGKGTTLAELQRQLDPAEFDSELFCHYFIDGWMPKDALKLPKDLFNVPGEDDGCNGSTIEDDAQLLEVLRLRPPGDRLNRSTSNN